MGEDRKGAGVIPWRLFCLTAFGLARGPAERASAEYMQVEVAHGLPSIRTGIDDDAVAIGKITLCEGGGGLEQVAEEFGRELGDVGEVLFGDDEKVGGRLRIDVGKDEREIVFVEGLDGNGVACDLAEETVWHELDPLTC